MEQESLQIGRQQQEALMQSVSLMNQVAKKIKVIPELPSEKPTDIHTLQKVEFPDEGQILTYMDGYDYPYRGYPYYEFVEKIDTVKKLTRQVQSGFYHGLKQTKLRWFLIPLIPTLGRSLFWAFTYSFHRVITRFQMKTNCYSKFVQELYRACSVEWGDESERIAEIRKMMRDIECMILEFDNAYRFRAQDLIPEIDKIALKRSPIKEINRFLDIWIEREKTVEIKDSWRLLKLFVNWYLRFDKPLLQMITRILLELDVEKCALTVEDKYFCVPRKDYSFGFMQNPTSEDQKLINSMLFRQEYDKKIEEIQIKSTNEHKILEELHQKEQKSLPADENFKSKAEKQIVELETKFYQIQNQNQREFEKTRDKIVDDLLSPEQRGMLKKQKEEKSALDAKFNAELAQAEKEYLERKAKI